MNIREFLSDPGIQLPLTRDSDDFQAFVENILDTYLCLIGRLDQPTSVVAEINAQRPNVEIFCKHAKGVIRLTLEGHPYDAYQAFLHTIKPIAKLIYDHSISMHPVQLGTIYRVRQQLTASLSREELFHIPFEKRHLVSTQR